MKKGRIVRKGAYRDICDTPEYQEVSFKTREHEEKEDKQKEEKSEAKIEAELAMIKDALQQKQKSLT